MDEDPFDRVAAAAADLGDRVGEYAAVWRRVVERNNQGDYGADDYLVDMQALWGMTVRDVARFGSAVVDAVAPLLPTDGPAGTSRGDDQGRTGSAGSS
jgi:hypothetical protein